jgi:hypothetical protein
VHGEAQTLLNIFKSKKPEEEEFYSRKEIKKFLRFMLFTCSYCEKE